MVHIEGCTLTSMYSMPRPLPPPPPPGTLYERCVEPLYVSAVWIVNQDLVADDGQGEEQGGAKAYA